MKNLLIFLFGAACGVGGTLIWLRKDIQKELEQIKKDSEIPFSVDENEEKTEEKESKNTKERTPVALKNQTKVDYNKIVDGNYSGSAPVPVMPRSDRKVSESDDPDDVEAGFVGSDETDGGIFEIDRDTFDHDESNEKDRLVYFAGDRIMCTENGKIITNPAILVGSAWETCVGNYTKNTAFIRNSRLVTDYEIYVEEGLYEDEYGPVTDYRED